MNDTNGLMGNSRERGVLERMMERAQAYIASRTPEHWVMFLVGLVIGLILG